LHHVQVAQNQPPVPDHYGIRARPPIRYSLSVRLSRVLPRTRSKSGGAVLHSPFLWPGDSGDLPPSPVYHPTHNPCPSLGCSDPEDLVPASPTRTLRGWFLPLGDSRWPVALLHLLQCRGAHSLVTQRLTFARMPLPLLRSPGVLVDDQAVLIPPYALKVAAFGLSEPFGLVFEGLRPR
jgi:hypothetical protein